MKNIYTVGQVNTYIKNMFAQDYMLRSITVSGELSNVKYHSSGHIYFTMKDKGGAIACVMFAGNTGRLTFRLSEGLSVETTGSISVYERDGKYQLYATDIKMAGAGALYEKYEQLKAELQEMGMFDPSFKRAIPQYAMRIGVVTAATGAAIQDITQIAGRRNPYVQLFLYPALVQGDGAKESIVKGIHYLENFGVDVIIVGRGGGSIEDLWAFNERCVAEAIFNCSVPVVSAVGHETDTTIADLVSDLRAPTPSAAAELTVFSYDEFAENVAILASSLDHYLKVVISKKKFLLKNYQTRLEALSPMNRIREKKLLAVNRRAELQRLMDNRLLSAKHRLSLSLEKMKNANPLEKLDKGYAFVESGSGKPLRDAGKVSVGDELRLHLRNGTVDAKVTGRSLNADEE